MPCLQLRPLATREHYPVRGNSRYNHSMRGNALIYILSLLASSLAHAGVFFGLTVLVAHSSREEAQIDAAPGEATLTLSWSEPWRPPTPVMPHLEPTLPVVKTIEPVLDPPPIRAVPEEDDPEIFDPRALEPETLVEIEPTPPQPTTPSTDTSTADDPTPTAKTAEPPAEIGRPGARGAAKLLGEVAPHYPRQCRRRGHEGTVLLECEIDVKGFVTQVRILGSSGCKELDGSAVKSVLEGRFSPATEDGVAVASSIRLPIAFRLRG